MVTIYGNFRPGVSSEASGFYYFNYFAAFVLAAMRAGTVGTDLLVTVGALGKLWNNERVMGASSRGAALRMAAFGIRHGFSSLLFSFKQR